MGKFKKNWCNIKSNAHFYFFMASIGIFLELFLSPLSKSKTGKKMAFFRSLFSVNRLILENLDLNFSWPSHDAIFIFYDKYLYIFRTFSAAHQSLKNWRILRLLFTFSNFQDWWFHDEVHYKIGGKYKKFVRSIPGLGNSKKNIFFKYITLNISKSRCDELIRILLINYFENYL